VEKPTFRDYSAPPPRIDLGGSKSLCVTDIWKIGKNPIQIGKNQTQKPPKTQKTKKHFFIA
jgi:hypothetical protein